MIRLHRDNLAKERLRFRQSPGLAMRESKMESDFGSEHGGS